VNENQNSLSTLRKRLQLVNQAIRTLENLASKDQLEAETLLQAPASRAFYTSNWASARKNSAQHRKRGGKQSEG
jgi:hypothetical protein